MIKAAKPALLMVQLLGLVLSALLVAATFMTPAQVEQRVQSFAIAKVEAAAQTAWDDSGGLRGEGSAIARLKDLAARFGRDADGADAQRRVLVPALLATALSDRCGEGCGLPAVAALAVDSVLIERAARLRVGETTLKDFIVGQYDSAVRGLINDLRRFGLVNMVALALMMGLVLFRDRLDWRFAALSVAVTGYTAWAAYGYVFTQNWALAILFRDWAGPGYQIAMIVVCCVFVDWLFFHGRITRFIVDAFTAALSSF